MQNRFDIKTHKNNALRKTTKDERGSYFNPPLTPIGKKLNAIANHSHYAINIILSIEHGSFPNHSTLNIYLPSEKKYSLHHQYDHNIF